MPWLAACGPLPQPVAGPLASLRSLHPEPSPSSLSPASWPAIHPEWPRSLLLQEAAPGSPKAIPPCSSLNLEALAPSLGLLVTRHSHSKDPVSLGLAGLPSKLPGKHTPKCSQPFPYRPTLRGAILTDRLDQRLALFSTRDPHTQSHRSTIRPLPRQGLLRTQTYVL